MKSHTLSILICAALVCADAGAQDALPIAAGALTFEREGAVNGCGVRLTGGAVGAGGPSTWFDVSFNVFRHGIALAQATAFEIRRADFTGESPTARVPLQSAWLRTANGNATLGENNERADTLVYPLRDEAVFELFDAVARGQTLSVGVQRWGDRVDAVYSGAPVLTDQTREQIGECLEKLLR